MVNERTPLENTVGDRESWRRIWRKLDNPVIAKELRSWMRGPQAIAILTGYLMIISVIVCIVYEISMTSTPNPASDPSFRQSIGKAVFGTVVLLELLLAAFIGPALTSGAVSSERERQTFDLLRTTTLSASSLIVGKLGASLLYLMLLMLAAVPIESLAFLLGGVGLEEIVISSLMLFVCALFFCALGLFFSSIMRRTLGATVGAYVVIVLSAIFLALALALISMDPAFNATQYAANVHQQTLWLVVWMLISTNPILAAVFSEVMLIDSQSAISGAWGPTSISLNLPLPWIPMALLYVYLTILMVLASIYFVSRPDR